MKTIVVLGMHRSATSLIAKGLDAVCHMGDDMLEPAKDNPEGFYENKRFLDLNIEILQTAGGNWLEPPSRAQIMAVKDQFDHKIRRLVEEESKDGIWGWKDPRTSLTIDLFHPHLINPHYVCVFRNPKEVAKSLSARGAYSTNKGINCAYEYNARILTFIAENHLSTAQLGE